jgi:hypothetical protein
MSLRSVVLFALLAAGSSVSCTGQQVAMDAASCVPGQTAACTCDGGARGAHACSDAGAFGACVCAAGDAAMDVLAVDAPNDMVIVDVPPLDTGDPCDMDGDGHRAATVECAGDDCDDTDPERHPGTLELCDGVLRSGRSAADHDEDCNPCTVFSDAIFGDGDADHDGSPGSQCRNPWLTAAPPAGCNVMLVRVVQASGGTAGYVAGADCNDDPAAVTAGDGGVVGTDAGDGGASLTGRDIHPGQVEVCNGIDDNCAGGIDEGDPSGGGSCGSGLAGICAPGVNHCVDGAIACIPNVAPGTQTETCNALDDDCDGNVDNVPATPCTTNHPPYPVGSPCSAGHAACSAGAPVCDANVGPSVEMCNGVDDDCDGMVDDGAETMCPGAMNAVASCSGGACGFTCNAGFGNCNGTPGDGCEVSLNTDPANCGACGRGCPAPAGGMAGCSGGTCTVGCGANTPCCVGTSCVCQDLSGPCTNPAPGMCPQTGSWVCSGTGRVCSAPPPQPMQTCYLDCDGDGRTGGATATTCTGCGSIPVPSGCRAGYLASPSGTPDCNDNNSSVYVNTTCVHDADGDNWCEGTISFGYSTFTICSDGSNCGAGSRTVSTCSGVDCRDGNPFVNSDCSTQCTTTGRFNHCCCSCCPCSDPNPITRTFAVCGAGYHVVSCTFNQISGTGAVSVSPIGAQSCTISESCNACDGRSGTVTGCCDPD